MNLNRCTSFLPLAWLPWPGTAGGRHRCPKPVILRGRTSPAYSGVRTTALLGGRPPSSSVNPSSQDPMHKNELGNHYADLLKVWVDFSGDQIYQSNEVCSSVPT